MTRFEKGAVPFLVLFALALGAVMLLLTRPLEQTWWSLAMGAVFGIVFCVAYRFRIWPLADEVFDCGDHLLVRRRGEEQRIRLEDIAKVELRRSRSSHRMVLKLGRSGPFGETVVFLAPMKFTLNPFAQDPLETELISRVDLARGRG